MGLIRKAIVLGGIIFALPTAPATDPLLAVQPNTQPSTFATISAAAETVADVKGFCERRPQACVTGRYLATTDPMDGRSSREGGTARPVTVKLVGSCPVISM